MTAPRFRAGEIIIAELPFSDQRETKRLPGVVLLDVGDDDIVVARVTSAEARSEHDVAIQSWRQAGLSYPIARLHKLTTFEKTDIVKRIGSLADSDFKKVREAIQRLWSSV